MTMVMISSINCLGSKIRTSFSPIALDQPQLDFGQRFARFARQECGAAAGRGLNWVVNIIVRASSSIEPPSTRKKANCEPPSSDSVRRR